MYIGVDFLLLITEHILDTESKNKVNTMLG